jgi:predicted membrane chloride channel (bestrophin family)
VTGRHRHRPETRAQSWRWASTLFPQRAYLPLLVCLVVAVILTDVTVLPLLGVVVATTFTVGIVVGVYLVRRLMAAWTRR